MLKCWSLFLTDTKIKKMGYQAVNRYACALEFVPDCYKIQKMGNKAVSNYPSANTIYH